MTDQTYNVKYLYYIVFFLIYLFLLFEPNVEYVKKLVME